jgi:SAM-dependent methyltransferase
MLTRFRANLPAAAAIRGLVQACAFQDGVFDAAVAWGVIFHLTRTDQVTAFASVSRVLKPGAPFLFTAGDVDDVDGFVEGTMNGVVFRYYSYGVEGYRDVLRSCALKLIDVTRDGGENIYYLARKC